VNIANIGSPKFTEHAGADLEGVVGCVHPNDSKVPFFLVNLV
jgi:hypothetical protein